MKRLVIFTIILGCLYNLSYARMGDNLGSHEATKDINVAGWSIVNGLNGTFTGNLTVDTPTLFVNSTTHRVGIGTLTPGQKLTVYDGFLEVTDPDSSTSILFSAPSNSVTSLLFRSGVANRWSIVRKATTEDLCVYDYSTSTSCVMTFQQGGNIGISTDTPSYKFDVNGIIRSTGIISTGDIDTTDYKVSAASYVITGSGEKVIIDYDSVNYGARISSSVYINGISSATAYYGDGSSLSGLGFISTADADLDMAGFRIVDVATITVTNPLKLTGNYIGIGDTIDTTYVDGDGDLYVKDEFHAGGIIHGAGIVSSAGIQASGAESNFQSAIRMYDDQLISFGTGRDFRMQWETAGHDHFVISTPLGTTLRSGNLDIVEQADAGSDLGHWIMFQPTLNIWNDGATTRLMFYSSTTYSQVASEDADLVLNAITSGTSIHMQIESTNVVEVNTNGIKLTGDLDATDYDIYASSYHVTGSGSKGIFYWNPTGGIDGTGAVVFSTHTQMNGGLNITGGNLDLNGGELTGAVLASSGTYGEIYTKDSSSVTVISASVYTRVLGTSSADALCNGWFTGTNNKLTYDYTTSKHFNIGSEISWTAVAKDKRVGFALFKNGVYMNGSAKSVNTNGAGTYNTITIGKCCWLNQGDYIEIYVKNYTDTTDITVTDMRLTIGNKP